MTHHLKAVADGLPAKPGVYFFKNARGETIYIGKARSLVDRVRSYFQPTDDPKVRNILAETTRLDYLLAVSEREAAFLENNFVQHHQPKFNLRLKDDKSFPYLQLTLQEIAPGVFFSRKVTPDGSRYFGPFSPAREARKTVQILTKSFRLRTCDASDYRSRKRPCLEYELKNCSAPCVGRIGTEEYRASVRDAVLFLEGRTKELTEALREHMSAAASDKRFEDAARYRDLLRTLEQIRARPKAISVRLENQDIIGYAQSGPLRAVHVFHMRGGKVRESREFVFERDPSFSPEDTLGEFLAEFYAGHALPEKVIVPILPSRADSLRAGWKSVAQRRVIISVPRRGSGRTLLEWAGKNAEILLRKSSNEHVALEELKSVLALRTVPVRIDGFDVSHTQGTETVASLVTFLGGRPWKDGYRRYKIRTVRGPDDTASMSEAVRRRFVRVLHEQQPLPDFVLVDGGLPQLHAARTVLDGLGLSDIPVASLAKREEILYTPARPEGIRLEPTSPALKLGQYIRDEAHRFAVSFHRSRRTKRSFA